MEADDRQVLLWKSGAEALELRKRVAHATRAKHLESKRGHGPAAQVSETQLAIAVYPFGDLPFGRGAKAGHSISS
jgi:hypothetical protein